MLHDNDNGILPTDLAKRNFPEIDGLYAVKFKNEDCIELIIYQSNEWLLYPLKIALNTISINSKIEFCIGPIPETN